VIRKIIKINEDLCNGCGQCISACYEGAIGIVENKAKLLREDYCDGLGNCLPVCPSGAIKFEEREAVSFDAEAVAAQRPKQKPRPVTCLCPRTRAQNLTACGLAKDAPVQPVPTHLKQWPVQIKLVPQKVSFFDGAHLLIAADCVAYAYGNFHTKYMKNRVTVIGCPKLDDIDYTEKLMAIFKMNSVESITIVRMEVPCCSGLENATRIALRQCGKAIPLTIVIISTDGQIISK